ncbi:ABC transporter substrate-binding protein [Amycolatopsis suaedae]|uniref:ABC transporter substrate-binding protein n=1 Tax=Amycolatopsis suaedae TaxID=2510978 RepID=A0A4Q7J8T8_9PSEU|nr:ABC transporter substrate-binding protein [Amycolatopsis suaedae]RZQ63336.1 ABC transporter substrate-binding protein [Amycolatopsis suaedae]
MLKIRRLAALSVALTTAVTLAACGGAEEPPPAEGGQAQGAFPVTLRNAFGETRIPAKPQRVVTLGINDYAVATALGANVVGSVKYYYPDVPMAPYVPAPAPEVLGLDSNGISLEKVAEYDPDLILATSGIQLDKSMYDKLTGIAPTVAFEKELYGSTMEADALTIGRALGEQAKAQELINAAGAAVARFKAELPRIAGRSYLFGQARGPVLPMVVGKDNLSTKFMTSLGMKVPDAFANAPANADLAPGTIGLSYERVEELDAADVLFMTFAGPGDQQTFESNELVRRLDLMRAGRYQATSIHTAVMLQAPNVVGVQWLLDQLRPTLQKIGA